MKKALLLMTPFFLILLATTVAHAQWTGDIFVGYTQSTGNTDKGSGQVSLNSNYKMDEGEFIAKANAFYGQTDNKMDTQKWDGLAKYLLSFPDDSNWFSSYQVSVDHDRFSDIDYRIVPAVGIGYHFSREEDWTWNADLALGYEITRYRTNSANDDETLALIGHTFAKKRVLENAFLSEDLTLIPGLESGSGFRVKSETAFTNPLNERMDLEIKYVVDYDSEAAPGKTSTDKQILAGIKYKF